MRHDHSRMMSALGALALTGAALLTTPGRAPAEGAKKPRLDAYGDPLPRGATARFGSLRWRTAGAIRAVAVSPDGKRVASVNMNGRVGVWDAATGRQLHELAGSEAGEGCLAFSPDGRYLATGGQLDSRTGSGEYRVRLWEVRTGKERARFPAQEDSIMQVAFTPEGTRVVATGFYQPVIVSEVPSGKQLREFRTRNPVGSFALSANGHWLAASDDDQTMSLYSFESGRKRYTLRTQGDNYHGFWFSPDSRSLLTVESQRVCCWEVATGKQRWQAAMKDAFWGRFQFAPDGRKIAVTGMARGIVWLDVATGKALGSWPGHRNWIYTLAFSADGRTVVIGEWGVLRVRDGATGKVLRGPSGPDRGCYSLAFSPDGKTLVVGSTDLHFLDGRTLRERARFHAEMSWGFALAWQSVEVSPDGILTAAIGPKGEIVLVDARTGKRVRTLRRPGWKAESLAFGPDGKRLYAVGHKDAALRVWDVQSGDEAPPLCRELVRTGNFPVNLVIDRGSAKLVTVTAGPSARCRLWNLRTGHEEPSLQDYPDKVLLSRGGKLLATYHYNSHINVWDVARRVRLRRLDFGLNAVIDWTFSRDGRLLITAHPDGAVRSWNVADGHKVAELRGHPPFGGIIALACSPDGTALVSACSGGTVLRWEAAAWQGK
jgi:WD40 repeat protein